jgi:LAO/AO transport system kinase
MLFVLLKKFFHLEDILYRKRVKVVFLQKITNMNRLSIAEYVSGIRSGNRIILSKAITLTESKLPSDQNLAQEVIQQILPFAGNSFRIGITGVPGVGKSTFIEAFGLYIIEKVQKKVAVLTIDPSSQKSGGSILGDKTRMESLSHNPQAFIRPSPSGNSLGGVAKSTRETILLCEAAGFETILIETVGVGQSETVVKDMTDFFLLLMLAGAGDELQGIKKGIMEMADLLLITKADSNNEKQTKLAKAHYENAMHLFLPNENGWQSEVLTCSSLTGKGLPEAWQIMEKYKIKMEQNGFFQENRMQQNIHWLYDTIRQKLEETFFSNAAILQKLATIENQVRNGEMPSVKGALTLLQQFLP